MITENKIKIIKKSVITGKDEKGKSVMLIEDASSKKFNIAMAPYDFRGDIDIETRKSGRDRTVSYVFPNMVDGDKAKKMYEELKGGDN